MSLLLIPLLPLLGFLVNATLGRKLTKTASGTIAVAAIGASFGVAVMVVWSLLHQAPIGGVRAVDQVVFSWIQSGPLSIPLEFRVDPLSSVMILVITGIGSLIHLYSTDYMHDETDGDSLRRRLRQPPAQRRVDDEPEEREQGDEQQAHAVTI